MGPFLGRNADCVFVLAIILFLAVVEFKLTTLKGFILVPFALWRGTSFIAEPVHRGGIS